ncbi:MAG: hypothetical protein LBS11_00735 [Oscillospiraceae bacterium]|jgi:hypothetical protein|nr:hypothetical protein [Oscillospiraceae bacterium]
MEKFAQAIRDILPGVRIGLAMDGSTVRLPCVLLTETRRVSAFADNAQAAINQALDVRILAAERRTCAEIAGHVRETAARRGYCLTGRRAYTDAKTRCEALKFTRWLPAGICPWA